VENIDFDSQENEKPPKPFTGTLYITVSDCLRARLPVLFTLPMVWLRVFNLNLLYKL